MTVEKLGEWLARHPVLVAAAFGVLCGLTGFNTFRAGMTYADLRRAVGEGCP